MIKSKSLLANLGIVLTVIGLVILSYVEVWGADWRYFARNDRGVFFYDAGSVDRPFRNTVFVWSKMILTEQGRANRAALLGDRFRNTGYDLILFEIDCADRRARSLAVRSYSIAGDLLGSTEGVSNWEFISQNSIIEALFESVCT